MTDHIEHFEAGMRDEINGPELKPKPEWLASFNGFTIHTKPELANGWIELRDEHDNIIAHIDNVKSIHLAPRRRP